MVLSETQIERFSRQIIVPEIGGTGQERLLASTVAIAGAGALAGVAARYLAGAGIGRLRLCSAQGWWKDQCTALRDLHPDVRLELAPIAGPSADGVAADLIVACDLPAPVLDQVSAVAAATGRPLVGGGTRDSRGWLCIVAGDPGAAACAACAARAAEALPPGAAALSAPAVGVIGSLMALAVLEERVGLPILGAGRCWQFDAEASRLAPWAVGAHQDCPRCRAAAHGAVEG